MITTGYQTTSRIAPTPTGTSDIPKYIEHTARQLGARYAPDHGAARSNLHADDGSVKSYLGTYFPRTVFEFKTIIGEMLDHAEIRSSLRKTRPLRILDLGSGTGGAWIGLALAVEQAHVAAGLSIEAIDGNATALAVQKSFAQAITAATGMPIDLNTRQVTLGITRKDFVADLSTALSALVGKFDVVLVSKNLSEFYENNLQASSGIVKEALKLLSGVLTNEGFLVVLDVTTQTKGSATFFPITMARETASYLRETQGGVRPVLPVPCAMHMASNCAGTGSCYTQRKLLFRHALAHPGYLRTEVTKVTYLVFTPNGHAEQICSTYPAGFAYGVNANKPFEACNAGRIVNAPDCVDGYKPLVFMKAAA
jgi:SAM-dependent methyltransferase